MKKRILVCFSALALSIFFHASTLFAHFGMVIPSDTMVMQQENRTVSVALSFSHPFEMIGMPLEKPRLFQVSTGGKTQDLRPSLKETAVMEQKGWMADYPVAWPGIHVFYMEPVPYWEPAEDCFIVHHTKAVMAAFGDDEGWDRQLGVYAEIVPMARPYGLYEGNVFQGVVKVDGKPVPDAVVEVEYYNEDNKVVAPCEYMISQAIKADKNGVFTYAAPRAGWWGFAALTKADYQLEHGGEKKDVEIGAVIWVPFFAWEEK